MIAATGPTRTNSGMLALAVACVTAIAALLHSGGMHDVIAWDEANYALAAEQGIVANALQLGELSQLRHRHAPLMCYAITVSTALFGSDEWAIRLPAIVLCALSAGLLVIIGHDLSRGSTFPTRLFAGTTAGLILATSPASIELAGVIQPHSFVVFFLLLNLWTLCRYLRDQQRRDAMLFGLSLAGQFVSMEYGPVILCYALAALAIARPALIFGEDFRFTSSPRTMLRALLRIPRTLHRDIKVAGILCLIATAAIWPAGVFLLGIPFNFVFFLLYAANGHPVLFRGEMQLHVPKYAYAYWYWTDYPLLLIAMVIALLLIAVWAWRDRKPVALTLAVFTFGLTASVHGAHIMQLCKSIFMIPAIALAGPLAVVWCKERITWQPHSRLALVPALALALAATVGGRITPMSREADPNQRLVAMAQTIADNAAPNDHVLAQGWPMVRYLLHRKLNRPDIEVERYDPRNFEIDRLGDRMNHREFAWALTIGPTTAAHQNCKVLTQLRTSWSVAADQSLPGREYRVYKAPTFESVSSAQIPANSLEKEHVTP